MTLVLTHLVAAAIVIPALSSPPCRAACALTPPTQNDVGARVMMDEWLLFMTC